MDFKNLRDWLFEVIAIILPGTISLICGTLFIINPTGFIDNIKNFRVTEAILLPFKNNTINVFYILGVSYTLGHFVQQLSIYVTRFYKKAFGVKHESCIDKVLSSETLRNYLIPPSSRLDIKQLSLSSQDFFMMLYPDVAKDTKRDLFIAIANFCCSIATVIFIVFFMSAYSLSATLLLFDRLDLKTSLEVIVISISAFYLFINRALWFFEISDAIVVNYFLNKFGSHYRSSKK